MRGKNTAAILAVALTMLLTTLAPVQAQSTCTPQSCPRVSTPTSLYFHIFDIFNNFPINTQMPNVTYFQVGGTNFPTIVEDTSGTKYDFNTIYGYSTSGPVEYDFIENGQPRFHPERGIAATVDIDPQAQFTVGDETAPAFIHIYVSLRDVIGTESLPNYMPTYTFRATMREGNSLGDDSALDSGTIIMQGEKTLHLISEEFAPLNGTRDSNGVMYVMPNADGIIHYAIPMAIESPRIPQKEGYHIRIDWYQDPSPDNSQNDRAAEGYMRLASQENYNPRLELAIMNPVYIDFIHPQVAAGILLIHTAENSPWGTYDVDVENIAVKVTDAAGNPVEANLQQVVSQNSHVHNLHNKSAEVTYLWRFRDEGVKDGDYTIEITVQNLAHTATAVGTASFHLAGKEVYGKDQGGNIIVPSKDPAVEEKSSPGAGLLVIATALGAALLVRRRKA